RDGRTTASVHLSSIDSAPGERFSAVMEIAPTGGLLRLDPNFTGTAASNGADVSDVLDMIQVVTYLILIILAFFVFLRRIRYQLIDVGSAARDGLIGGVAAGIALGGRILSEVPWSLSFELLMAFFGIAVIALLAGVLIFFLSSTATSSVRDEWNEKMQTLDLVRGAYVRNVPVGRSLVRGALMGLSIVGLLAAALTLLPVDSLILSSDPLFFTSAVPGTDFMIAAMSAVFLTIFVAYLVVVGPAAIIRARTSSPTIVIGVVALTLLITQISPLDVHPVAYSFALSGVIGLVLGWTLWRFDVLSLIVSLFVFTLLWDVVPGWVVTSTPEFVGAGLSLLLVGGLVVLGGVGVAGGRTGDDIPTIVPDYIEELTRKERLERELELARSMQLSFLPRANPEMEGLDIASVCLPAYDVGGDYYDFFELDDRTLAFVVGDVSGKGMEAAFYMTLMKGILQSLVHEGARPARVLTRANAIFRRNAARDTFMSMALCVIDLEEGTLTFARAGHNPLLLRKAAGRLEVVKPAGAALGLTEPAMFEASIEEVTFHLDEGDVVIVYTDGVTEAMNPRRELYGEDRLEAAVAIQTGAEQDDASRLVRRIVDDVNGFRRNAPSHDDMTLLVVRRVNTDHSPDHSSSSR
ncbi:MAG: PP2C family protein-serine/threonine phosphatase, partial [Rhodothermales bacterium]